MKAFVVLVAGVSLVSIFWMQFIIRSFHEEEYLPQHVLDTARPVDVTIDIEFLRSFDPAYE